MDILTALYYKVMNIDPQNPTWKTVIVTFTKIKGHAVESYWGCDSASIQGILLKEELKTFSQSNTRLIGHPNNKVPGVKNEYRCIRAWFTNLRRNGTGC